VGFSLDIKKNGQDGGFLRGRPAARCGFSPGQAGNVAITFALALLPLVGATGAPIDYSRGSNARTALQAALDAAGLILSKEAQGLTTAQLLARAESVVKANLPNPNIKGLVVTPTFTTIDTGSFKLTLSATGTVDTTVAAIWQPTMAIGSTTEVLWGMKRLELALCPLDAVVE
jgi:Flp pilus assembly protein TadG